MAVRLDGMAPADINYFFKPYIAGFMTFILSDGKVVGCSFSDFRTFGQLFLDSDFGQVVKTKK